MASIVAKRYALAFYQLAEQSNKIDAVTKDVKQLARLIKESEEFKRFIDNPVISSIKRSHILRDLLQGSLDELTLRFLIFLEYKKRFSFLPGICACFEEHFLQAHNVARVVVVSRQKLSEYQVKNLEARFQQKFKQDILLEQKIDEKLIGGIKLQYGDTIYDYTLRKHLDRYKEAVLK
jgi:F-type H+-transporting ATPase subunit delta